MYLVESFFLWCIQTKDMIFTLTQENTEVSLICFHLAKVMYRHCYWHFYAKHLNMSFCFSGRMNKWTFLQLGTREELELGLGELISKGLISKMDHECCKIVYYISATICITITLQPFHVLDIAPGVHSLYTCLVSLYELHSQSDQINISDWISLNPFSILWNKVSVICNIFCHWPRSLLHDVRQQLEIGPWGPSQYKDVVLPVLGSPC